MINFLSKWCLTAITMDVLPLFPHGVEIHFRKSLYQKCVIKNLDGPTEAKKKIALHLESQTSS